MIGSNFSLNQTLAAFSLDRPRLVQKVASPFFRPLTIISAPPGFGKTTMLAQLGSNLEAKNIPVFWHVLDENDNDLSRLSRVLGRASELAVGEPRLDKRYSACVVFDDSHILTNPAAIDLAFNRFRKGNPKTAILVAGRTVPDIALGRLRMIGEVCELDANDLKLTKAEAQVLYARLTNVEIDLQQLDELYARTEGWVAAFQLAAQTLRSPRALAERIKTVTGKHRDLVDFLAEEVFNRQPETVQKFLLRTSVLPRFSAAAASLLTGVKDSVSLIRHLEIGNLFIVPLDKERQWFRYHELFREFLLAEFERRYPDDVKLQYAKAAKWFAAHAAGEAKSVEFADAFRLAISAGDEQLAGEILENGCEALFKDGHMGLLMSLAELISPDKLEAFPKLQLIRVWALGIGLRAKSSRKLLASVHQRLEKHDFKDRDVYESLHTLAIHREMIIAAQFDRVSDMERYSNQLEEECQLEDRYLQATVINCKMYVMRERYEVSLDRLEDKSAIRLYDTDYGYVWWACLTGPSHVALGSLKSAEEIFSKALTIAMQLEGGAFSLGAMPAFLLANVYWEQGDTENAETLASKFYPFVGKMGIADELIAAFRTRAALSEHNGKIEQALEMLQDGIRLGKWRQIDRLVYSLSDDVIRILLARGDRASAIRALPSGISLADRPVLPKLGHVTSLDEWKALSWARLALASGDVRDAVAILRAWFHFVDERRYLASLLRVGPLYCEALLKADDRPKAHSTLLAILREARKGPYIGSWWQTGACVEELLRSMITRSRDEAGFDEYLQKVVSRIKNKPSDKRVINATEIPASESLTNREAEVLYCLGNGWANKDIGAELGISIATVKYHLQQIYQKLHVTRRSEALTKARTLGLISKH